MNKKVANGIEFIWLFSAILSLLTGLYETKQKSLDDSYVWYIMTVIAFLMYTFRRYYRKQSENKNKTNP